MQTDLLTAGLTFEEVDALIEHVTVAGRLLVGHVGIHDIDEMSLKRGEW